jgi:L-threonylcarbamoyladenylate synthase
MMETRVLPGSSRDALKEAAGLLSQGELVAFPTDTVYGLGAQVYNPQSIERLYIVKGREASKAIAVLIGDFDFLREVVEDIGEPARRLAKRFWPGPLTLVVPGNASLPANLSPTSKVGVRMPDHPVALQLLRMTGPLAVTSANLSGRPNTQTAQQVLEQLGGLITVIIDGGKTPGGTPSTVVDCIGDEFEILREGPINLEQLRAVLH